MKKVNLIDILEKVIMLLCVLVFFANGNILTKYLAIFQYSILFFSILYCLCRTKIKTNSVWVLWLLVIIYFALGLFYSYNVKGTISMLKMYACFFPLLLCSFDRKNLIKFFKILEIVIIVGAISIIASVLIDEFVLKYFSFFITNDPSRILSELNESSFSGLFAEKGNAAFMLNIGIGIIISKCLSIKKMKFGTIVELLLFVVALIFTNKRALLVFPVLIFLIIYVFMKDKNKIIKIIKIGAIGCVALVVLLKVAPVMGGVFERFVTDDDNHRSELREICLQMHDRNNIVGMGLNSYNQYAYDIGFRLYISGTENGVWKYHAHNIYYQILAEGGFIGLFLVVFTFCYSIYKTIRVLRMDNDVIDDRKRLIIVSLFIQLLFVLYGWTGNTFYYYQQVLIYFISLIILIGEINYKNENIMEKSLLEKEAV